VLPSEHGVAADYALVIGARRDTPTLPELRVDPTLAVGAARPRGTLPASAHAAALRRASERRAGMRAQRTSCVLASCALSVRCPW